MSIALYVSTIHFHALDKYLDIYQTEEIFQLEDLALKKISLCSVTDAISLKDFKSHMAAQQPPPKPQHSSRCCSVFQSPSPGPVFPKDQGDWQLPAWSLSLPQSRSLVQGCCCEVVWQRLLLLPQSPESLWRWFGSVKTHGNGTPSAWAAHVVCRTRRKGNVFFSHNYQKELARSQRKLQLVLVLIQSNFYN